MTLPSFLKHLELVFAMRMPRQAKCIVISELMARDSPVLEKRTVHAAVRGRVRKK